jgi:hypothetical protein
MTVNLFRRCAASACRGRYMSARGDYSVTTPPEHAPRRLQPRCGWRRLISSSVLCPKSIGSIVSAESAMSAAPVPSAPRTR